MFQVSTVMKSMDLENVFSRPRNVLSIDRINT